MKLFLWQRIDKVSHSYHPEGGLVVVAPSLEAAREQIKQDSSIPDDCPALERDPCRSYELANDACEELFVFEDSGCC